MTIVLRLTKYGKTEAFKSTVSNEQFAKTKEMEVRKSIQNVMDLPLVRDRLFVIFGQPSLILAAILDLVKLINS